MADQGADHELLTHIDREELVDLGKSLIRVPSFIGEETPAAEEAPKPKPKRKPRAKGTRWSSRKWSRAGSRRWPS